MFKKINGILVGVSPFMDADKGGAGGGGAAGDDKGTDKGADDKDDNPDPEGDDKDADKGNKKDDTETPEQIAKKAEEAAQKKFLKSLGVSDLKTAKEKLAALKEIEDKDKTDAQKAAEKALELETNNTTLSSENTELKLQVAVLKADVKPEAMEDVIILAKNLVTDDVDFDKAVETVLKKHTYFKKDAEAEDTQQQSNKKPKFSGGEHKSKGKETEQDAWNNNFNWFGTQEK